MAQTGTKRKRKSVLDYVRVSTIVSDTEGAGTNATNKENCDQNGGSPAHHATATCDIISADCVGNLICKSGPLIKKLAPTGN